jgi:mono/diheme cytochrome c family protein
MSRSGRISTSRPTPGWRQRIPRAVAVLLVVGAAACDDQLKYIPTFSSMAEQPSLEAYERAALESPPGAVALGSERTWTLLESDSLASPLASGDIDLELGGEQFQIFCSVCHGSDARGKGPVVGLNRIPDIPTLDLIWGMITNGRGLMPSYRRIPATVRWQMVAYVRALQAGEVVPSAETAGPSASEAE